MFFWFIGLSLWSVWFVFHDPAIDLRMVVVGSVEPGLLRVSWLYTPLHSVVVVAVLMTLTMLATIHRRRIRRRAIFIIFGMFLALAFDGAWSNTKVFWWPLAGHTVLTNLHPTRSLGLLVLQELIGLALTMVFIARMHIADPENRSYFVRTGRLPIEVARPVTFGHRPT